MNQKDIVAFEGWDIRYHYDEETDRWYFSIIDIISALLESPSTARAQSYWSTLKGRLRKEGSQVVGDCQSIRMISSDGKQYKTDVADIETVFRLIQSIPSKKAEPIKLFLAEVGRERIQEINDPERSINRARDNWMLQGRTQEWIQRRMSGQETRSKLTDYWDKHEVKSPKEYAALTSVIHQKWSGLSVKDHKAKKGLKSQNLRDHMSEAELLLTALAELSTRQIAEVDRAKGFGENEKAAIRGGGVAHHARSKLEEQTGKGVVTGINFLPQKSTKKINND